MPQRTEREYGPDSTNQLDEATNPDADGARAALATFYYALNHRDDAALAAVWATSPLAQLNNPVGGVLRGGEAITALYGRILHGAITLTVTLGDIVEYVGADHVVVAGRETGHYTTADGDQVPVSIRTTRYLQYTEGRWWQYHHHGSIDDAQALAAYQAALA